MNILTIALSLAMNQPILLPEGAQVLSVTADENGNPVMTFVADPTAPLVTRHVYCVVAPNPYPEPRAGVALQWIGTVNNPATRAAHPVVYFIVLPYVSDAPTKAVAVGSKE